MAANRTRGRVAREPSGSLLWLWVLLGSGTAGLALGSVGYLAIAPRPQPDPTPTAAPELAAEKPRAQEPPESPKPVEVPKPAPKREPEPAPSVDDGSIPSAQTLDGLKFYLPFDTLANARTPEVVSGSRVGPIGYAELIAGRRGKALRVSATDSSASTFALPLTDQAAAFRVPAEAPFTFCLWARLVSVTGGLAPALQLFGGERKPKPGSQDELRLAIALEQHGGRFSSSHSADGRPAGHGRNGSNTPFKTPPMGEWFHLALVRSGTDRVKVLVNGRAQAYQLHYPFALDFETLGMVRASGAAAVEVDELCLFDRALTTEELNRLGGRPPGDNPPPDGPPTSPPPAKPVAVATPHPVPPASDLPGLLFYLDCESADNGTVAERVSGQRVGKGVELELTDGARGKALRLTHERTQNGNWCALDLSDQKERLAIPAGKPFTLAFWARRVVDHGDSFFMPLIDFRTALKAVPDRSLRVGLSGSTPAPGQVALSDRPSRDAAFRSTSGTFLVREPAKWTHLALVRDDGGEVRLWAGGTDAKKCVPCPAELRYDTLGLVAMTRGNKTVIDIDEFCLFDRALTAAELGQLAGQKAAPSK